jgi:hypothetical protein
MFDSKILALGLVAAALAVTPVAAQQGPVAQSCGPEMEKFCAGKKHGQGEMRACLEANKDKVSDACRHALDTTGPGKGMGQGMGGMGGMGGGMGR